MVRRSRKRRKWFSCQHRGFGTFCHRCQPSGSKAQPLLLDLQKMAPMPASEIRRSQKKAQRQVARWQWQQSFTQDPIDLSHLPKPIVIKTRQILHSLNQGVAPERLQGKRFKFDRTLLRIPITYRYRLLCRWQSRRIIPLQVLSHEAYNSIARNKKRVSGS